MMAFPGMLVGPAKKAGIKVPDNPEEFDRNEYTHFFVFCQMQLGRRMPYASCVWDNAEIIASIPDEEIKKVSTTSILAMGYN